MGGGDTADGGSGVADRRGWYELGRSEGGYLGGGGGEEGGDGGGDLHGEIGCCSGVVGVRIDEGERRRGERCLS